MPVILWFPREAAKLLSEDPATAGENWGHVPFGGGPCAHAALTEALKAKATPNPQPP